MAVVYCWPTITIKHGTNLVFARRVFKAEFEWTFDHLLTIDSSWLSNVQATCGVTSTSILCIRSFMSGIWKQICYYFNFV